eukprot:CAMPEP_0170442864 /NCGR_PEP_ID=MMETSP0117_2-20130122/47664_1 /TAXON_ID=400756 /ORGANISM="Durinskia baltica, Strain CSIRO CS-38" /LENGTH=213 /DNA_ID=CAMNT_0010703519 /DNA_START=74 /DNA_END=712 /DNA_ORIENTATION=-
MTTGSAFTSNPSSLGFSSAQLQAVGPAAGDKTGKVVSPVRMLVRSPDVSPQTPRTAGQPNLRMINRAGRRGEVDGGRRALRHGDRGPGRGQREVRRPLRMAPRLSPPRTQASVKAGQRARVVGGAAAGIRPSRREGPRRPSLAPEFAATLVACRGCMDAPRPVAARPPPSSGQCSNATAAGLEGLGAPPRRPAAQAPPPWSLVSYSFGNSAQT